MKIKNILPWIALSFAITITIMAFTSDSVSKNDSVSEIVYEKIGIVVGDCVVHVDLQQGVQEANIGDSLKIKEVHEYFFDPQENGNTVDTLRRQSWIEDDKRNVICYGNFTETSSGEVFFIIEAMNTRYWVHR